MNKLEKIGKQLNLSLAVREEGYSSKVLFEGILLIYVQ